MRPSRGWLARRTLLPWLYWCVHHGWVFHWCFIFKWCLLKHLVYYLSLYSHPYMVWTISWGPRSDIEGPVGALICASFIGGFQGFRCIQTYPHPKYLSFLVGFLFWPRVCPALLGGFHSFLRSSAVLGGDPKFSEDLTVFSVPFFPYDQGFTFPSRCLYLVWVSLSSYVWEVRSLNLLPLNMKASIRRICCCFRISSDSAEGEILIEVKKLRLDLLFWFLLLTHHVT